MAAFTFTLYPVPPFRLDLTAWALRRRPDNQIDVFDRGRYSRVLPVGETAVEVSLSQDGPPADARVEVRVQGVRRSGGRQSQIAATVEQMLGMRTDLSRFYAVARRDARLGSLAQRFIGLKPPRFPTLFEAMINGIACQQLSLNVGVLLLNRLCEACGLSVRAASGVRHAFPRPEDLLKLDVKDLRALGFSTRKAEFLLDLSRAVRAGELNLEALAAMDRPHAVDGLTRLRGIGRWTAEYVLLRGLGDLSVFPGDDVGGRSKLRRWLGIREPLSYEKVQEVTSKWRPYQGMIYFHLLLDGLSEQGYIAEVRD